MKKLMIFTMFLVGAIVGTGKAYAQMSFTKYVPKYIHVEPVLDYVEHMIVEVKDDKVCSITKQGEQKIVSNYFPKSLQNWEKEGWHIDCLTSKVGYFGQSYTVYVFKRQVFKKGEETTDEIKKTK